VDFRPCRSLHVSCQHRLRDILTPPYRSPLFSKMTYHRSLALVNDRPGLIFMASIVSVLCITFVALRFKARKLTRTAYEADDWVALAALVRPNVLLLSHYISKHFLRSLCLVSMASSWVAQSKVPSLVTLLWLTIGPSVHLLNTLSRSTSTHSRSWKSPLSL
jgi:hypothetical protein